MVTAAVVPLTMIVGIAPKAGALGRFGQPALPAEAAGVFSADADHGVVEPKFGEIEQAVDHIVTLLGAIIYELAVAVFVGDKQRRCLAAGEIAWKFDVDFGTVIERADRTPARLVAVDGVVEIQLIEGNAGDDGVGIALIRGVDRRDLARQAVERIGPGNRGIVGGTLVIGGSTP